MNSRNVKKIKYKIFKVMKLTFKNIFSKLLLRLTFDDRFWRSHIDILYLNTYLNNRGHREKWSISNNILLLLIGLWPRKPRLSYTRALVWSTLLCLHSIIYISLLFVDNLKPEMISLGILYDAYLNPLFANSMLIMLGT